MEKIESAHTSKRAHCTPSKYYCLHLYLRVWADKIVVKIAARRPQRPDELKLTATVWMADQSHTYFACGKSNAGD